MILKIALIGLILTLSFSIVAGIIGMLIGDYEDEERKDND